MISPYSALIVVIVTVIWLVWRSTVFFKCRCCPCTSSTVSPPLTEIHAESFSIHSIPKGQPEKTTNVRVHVDASMGSNSPQQEANDLAPEGRVERRTAHSRHGRIWPNTSANALALLNSTIDMVQRTRNFSRPQSSVSEHSRSSVATPELEDEMVSYFNGKLYRAESVGSLGLSALCSHSLSDVPVEEMIEASPANPPEQLERAKRLQRLAETQRKQENEVKEQAELAAIRTTTKALMYKAAVLRDLQAFRDENAGIDAVPDKKGQRPMLRDSCSQPELNVLPPRPQTWAPGMQHLATFKQRSKEMALSQTVPAVPQIAESTSSPVATTSTNVNMSRLAKQIALAEAEHNPYPKAYGGNSGIHRTTGFYLTRASPDSSFSTRVFEPTFSSSSHAPSAFASSSHAPSAMLFTSSHAATSLFPFSHPSPSLHAPLSQSRTRTPDSASNNSSNNSTPILVPLSFALNNSSNSMTPALLPTRLAKTAALVLVSTRPATRNSRRGIERSLSAEALSDPAVVKRIQDEVELCS
eukprot:gb/GEZN01005077.1/.p1 GENE.gb/GEZN01005077.1/~~gb/GEZN01005077.1/.p1  ORF type:complete len:527 (+),score=46.95 gb/GEZN01005077.1/:103-1683(+)